SATQCSALASPGTKGAGLGVITLSPRTPNPAAQVRTLSGSTLEFLTCPTTHLCVAAGYNDGVIVLNSIRVQHDMAMVR
ncbi:MAG TPA: hypothetical protein VIK04_18690, partial [Solirubrobacteraceae bacterium]